MPDVTSTVTPSAQLNEVYGKQKAFGQQLDTNTTKAANTQKLGIADSLESQKAAAKQAAMASGRPWTNEDERQWAARRADQERKAANELTLQREGLQISNTAQQGQTANAQVGALLGGAAANTAATSVANQYELGQGALANQRYATNQSTAASQAQLAAQQQYQQAQVQLQQQQLASQQAAQLAGLMHGPGTPAALPAAPPPTAAPRSFNSWSSSPVPTSAAPAQSAALNPLMGFGGAYQSYANQMSRGF